MTLEPNAVQRVGLGKEYIQKSFDFKARKDLNIPPTPLQPQELIVTVKHVILKSN